MGNFSRNVEKVCVDFQKQWWRKEIMGGFFKKCGEGLGGFPKAVVAEGNHGGIFWGKMERVCVDFQETILAGGNYGGTLQESWRGIA